MTGRTHSYRIQEAAFDLFCAGHTRRAVRDELAGRYSVAAPLPHGGGITLPDGAADPDATPK